MICLEYSIDFSRLKLTALDINKNKIEESIIGFVGFKPTHFCLIIQKG